MTVPYVHSNYERIEDDNYQTVDARCVQGLVESVEISGRIVDVCSPSGSGIVEHLKVLGYDAIGISDAFQDVVFGHWIVTNIPYKKDVVNIFIERQIERVERGEVVGAAFLLRTNFDHAKTRKHLFKNPLYYGQVKLCFRPYWTEERVASPIHNYVWHIWMTGKHTPRVMYW